MTTASGEQPRRATSDDVRAMLFADPRAPWSPPRSSETGLAFTLRSDIDIEWLRRRLNKTVPEAQPGAGTTRLRVLLAGDYLRAEDLGEDEHPPVAAWLHHTELGGVYLSLEDRVFLPLSPFTADLVDALADAFYGGHQ